MYHDTFKASQNIQLQADRHIGVTCNDYFKVIFLKKQFMKKRSFTNFWFITSRS